jgi:hypothetical protein
MSQWLQEVGGLIGLSILAALDSGRLLGRFD